MFVWHLIKLCFAYSRFLISTYKTQENYPVYEAVNKWQWGSAWRVEGESKFGNHRNIHEKALANLATQRLALNLQTISCQFLTNTYLSIDEHLRRLESNLVDKSFFLLCELFDYFLNGFSCCLLVCTFLTHKFISVSIFCFVIVF